MSEHMSFIIDNVNELMIQDRCEILQMIYNSPARSKLKEKGNGTQIKLGDIPDTLIKNIHDFIVQKLEGQQIKLI